MTAMLASLAAGAALAIASASSEARASVFAKTEQARASVFAKTEQARASVFAKTEQARESVFAKTEQARASMFAKTEQARESVFERSAASPRPVAGYKGAPAKRLIHAGKAQTLYDQRGSNSGTGIDSQNFETFYDAYDDEAADDFIVPEGMRWKISEVDMEGYYNEGPAESMNVAFYKDRRGKPGKLIEKFTVPAPDTGGVGSFPIDLGGSVTLKPGQYWLSIQANQDFEPNGEWLWASMDNVVRAPAMWRNPGDGFETGCTDWAVENICVPLDQGDHIFALKGKVKINTANWKRRR